MLIMASIMLASCCVTAAVSPANPSDTIRLEVGSPEVNGRIYAPHAARVRVRVGEGEGKLVSEWTNELTVGDSAGRQVHRWVTKGTQHPPGGGTVTWELRQTFDAITLAPLGYASSSSSGGYSSLKIDGRRVHGVRRPSKDAPEQSVDMTIDRPGFIASASDLVPLAVGLKEGRVMTAPLWSPAMTTAETRIFTVIGKTPVDVEGTVINAWKVEERRHSDRTLMATWWLVEDSPYMVYGEVPMPNGQVRRMTEVAIPTPVR